MAKVRYFAAAAEASGTNAETVDADTLGALRQALVAAHGPDFARVLERCSILVDGTHVDSPEAPLAGGSLVDVLPPFAGG